MPTTRTGLLGRAAALVGWRRIVARASSSRADQVAPAPRPVIAEPHGAWLTAEQNQLLGIRNTAERGDARTGDAMAEARAGCQLLEIFTAIVPFERG